MRKALDDLLVEDSDFSAFCSDFFPDVYRRFTSGMDRVDRTTRLLQRVATEHIWAALCVAEPVRCRDRALETESLERRPWTGGPPILGVAGALLASLAVMIAWNLQVETPTAVRFMDDEPPLARSLRFVAVRHLAAAEPPTRREPEPRDDRQKPAPKYDRKKPAPTSESAVETSRGALRVKAWVGTRISLCDAQDVCTTPVPAVAEPNKVADVRFSSLRPRAYTVVCEAPNGRDAKQLPIFLEPGEHSVDCR